MQYTETTRGDADLAHVDRLLTAPGLTGYYTDDKRAILDGAEQDGFAYLGEPRTSGFARIRQPGESVLVALRTEEGVVGLGDCCSPQYSGAGGRDRPFIAREAMATIEGQVAPRLEGRDIADFRSLSVEMDGWAEDEPSITASIRYGVSQAILNAVAQSQRVTAAEVVANEYGLDIATRPIPIYAQCGEDRYINVDKMIMKQIDIVPHGLINNAARLVGNDGAIFLDYVSWVRDRILKMRPTDKYHPILHFDTYGTIGTAFQNDVPRLAEYVQRLEAAAAPFELILEMPMDLGSQSATMDGMVHLHDEIVAAGMTTKLMIDEWCNTLDDAKAWIDCGAIQAMNVKTIALGGVHNIADVIIACNDSNVLALMGGSCNETDISAMVCANIAMATTPAAIAGRPGMGVDEGVMTVYNEMQRVCLLQASTAHTGRTADSLP